MEESLFSFPTPFTPPTTEEDESFFLRLIRSRRVGPTTFWRLLQEHGSARAALAALPEIAAEAGIRDYTTFSTDAAMAEMRAGKRAGAVLVCAGDAAYPAALGALADAPPLFWALGDLSHLARPMVAMVGARNASSLGQRMTRRLAQGLVEAGFTVVSGLARGIDTAAHEAALPATIAVQAGGIDVVYPSENAALSSAIGQRGLCIAEQPVGTEPLARHFPVRNRIIAGLARATVVVEAALRSGSLITARAALDLGREVMAVPGHPFDARAAGCNLLIRDGAVLVRGPEDIVAALANLERPDQRRVAPTGPAPESTAPVLSKAGPSGSLPRPSIPRPAIPPEPGTAPPPLPASPPTIGRSLAQTTALHSLILDRLGAAPLAEDQLIRDLNSSAAEVSGELLALELDGRVARRSGGLISRLF